MKKSLASQTLGVAGGLAVVAMLGACATPVQYKEPVAVTPPSGSVGVTQAVTILDASGSENVGFPGAKATLESIVAAMPSGRYEASQLSFGGSQRETAGGGNFDRATLAAAAKGATFLQGSTPLYSVLDNEVTDAIGDGSGRAAVVIISDGLATDYQGRADEAGRAIASARALSESRSGEVCFHTVQNGNDPAGATLLRSIADVTSCGSFTTTTALGSSSALQQFSRNVYLSKKSAVAKTPAAAVNVAAAPRDTDGDGVIDPRDECPGTLSKAPVDSRGCWRLNDLRFAVNGAGIETDFDRSLAADIAVLKANPGVRIRVDGHTDSDGPAAYNQGLSERRASAVRDRLVAAGISADRLEVKGFGESEPVAPNDSAANKRRNRRVELTILD